MRFLSLFVLIVFYFTAPLAANNVQEHKKLPLEVSLPLLKTIESDAIRMGSGPVEVHVFIDPMCPHSRNFIEMIAESDKMRSRYSYRFYLYTLPRMHSEKMVKTIYADSDPLALLLDVMVYKKKIALKEVQSEAVLNKIESISKTAQQLDVYKRPYLVMIKKPKKKREK